MKISNQVCTLEQAKRLKELGVAQESLCWYVHHVETELVVAFGYSWTDDPGYECYPNKWSAFTVTELGVMLPGKTCVPVKSLADDYWFDVINNRYDKFQTEAEARAALLIDLLHRDVITIEEVNQHLYNA